MSMLDCPNDFHRENCSFSAFEKKTGYRRTDHPTIRRTRPHIEDASKNDKRTSRFFLGKRKNSFLNKFFCQCANVPIWCVLASLYEVVSVGWSVGWMVTRFLEEFFIRILNGSLWGSLENGLDRWSLFFAISLVISHGFESVDLISCL